MDRSITRDDPRQAGRRLAPLWGASSDPAAGQFWPFVVARRGAGTDPRERHFWPFAIARHRAGSGPREGHTDPDAALAGVVARMEPQLAPYDIDSLLFVVEDASKFDIGVVSVSKTRRLHTRTFGATLSESTIDSILDD